MIVAILLLVMALLLATAEDEAPHDWTRDAWDAWKRRHGISHHW